jgi:hypothetical protein
MGCFAYCQRGTIIAVQYGNTISHIFIPSTAVENIFYNKNQRSTDRESERGKY